MLAGRVVRRIVAEGRAAAHAHRWARQGRAGWSPAMFAAGLAHAAPGGWGVRALAASGVRTLTLRPARLGGASLVIDPADAGHRCVVEELFVPPVSYDLAR